MSEQSKQARADMKAKAKRMAAGEPGAKVDASSWSPPEGLNADKQTGLRPVSPRQFKRGGKLKGKAAAVRADRKARKSGGATMNRRHRENGGETTAEALEKEITRRGIEREIRDRMSSGSMLPRGPDMAHKRGGRARKSGGAAMVADKINRNVKDANAEKFGKPHEGGMKRGGKAKRPGKAFGGQMGVPIQAPGGLSQATLSPEQIQALNAQLSTPQSAATQQQLMAQQAAQMADPSGPYYQFQKMIQSGMSPQAAQMAMSQQLGGNPALTMAQGVNRYDDAIAQGTYGGPRAPIASPQTMGAMYGMAPTPAYAPPTSPPPAAPTSPAPMQQAAPVTPAFDPSTWGAGTTPQLSPAQIQQMTQANTQSALQNGLGQAQDGRSPYYNPSAARPAMGGMMGGMGARPAMGGGMGQPSMAGGFGRPRKSGGSVNSKSGGNYDSGTRPTGGRIARASGGKTGGKGKTNIIIAVNPQGSMGGGDPMQQAQRQQMPVPVQSPPPPQGVPMQMPPGPPPAAGGAPPAQMGPPPGMMPRKSGGRTLANKVPKETASSYKDMTAGSLGGIGRMQKTSIAEKQGRKLGGLQ